MDGQTLIILENVKMEQSTHLIEKFPTDKHWISAISYVCNSFIVVGSVELSIPIFRPPILR